MKIKNIVVMSMIVICMIVLSGCSLRKVEGPIYYFYDNTFMGSLEKGVWYSPLNWEEKLKTKTWKYSEILGEENYNIYGRTSGLKIILEPGIGDFLGLGLSEKDSEKMEEYRGKLKEYANPNVSSSFSTMELPVELEEDLSNLETTFENSTFSYASDWDIRFMTNADFGIKFAKEDLEKELSENVKKYIEKYIKENKLAEDIEYVCLNKYMADVDGDKKDDGIYFLSSKEIHSLGVEEMDKAIKANGYFSLILVDYGKDIDVVYTDSIEANSKENEFVYDTKYISSVDVVDLDNDNDYECAITLGYLGGRDKFIADFVDGECQIVTFNYYGQ